jgi:hypothetical protein
VVDIVGAGVTTEYPGGQPRTTTAGDTVATIAAYYGVAPDELAQNLTLASADAPLFRPVTPVNVTALSVPASLVTVSAGADWLGTTVADLLEANAARTDFFAPTSTVTIGGTSYTPQPQDTLTDVAGKFGGLAALARGMAEVDAGSQAGSYALNPAAPPRALQALPQISLQSSKASLSQSATLTSLLTVNRPSEQRKLVLDLDFVPNQLEFDIHAIAGVAGYEGSSWLSFVRPLDPAPNAIGQVAVPIALRGYPVPAVISGQQALPPDAGGQPDSTLTQWTYRFNSQRPFAAQDEMTLEISFNDAEPTQPATRGTADRSAVILALAGFSAIWPAVSKDLAAVPLLLGSPTPDEQAAARNALAALASVAQQVEQAWGSTTALVRGTAVPTSFQYNLSTLAAADGKVDALVLDRVGQAIDFSEGPDAFLFLADPAYAADLAKRRIPPGLATAFADHGLPLSGNAAVTPAPSSSSDWMIVDNGDGSSAPQTWRLLLQAGPPQTLQVWRQLLWPALVLGGGNGPSTPLPSSQAGTRLTYTLSTGQEISDGASLDLEFSFYRLDAMTLADAWGGFWISRNANLLDDVNHGFVYETPLTRFPTRITPYIQRPDPVLLEGDSLVDALSGLFAQLFAGQASLAAQDAAPRVRLPLAADGDSGAATRNVRVQAGYWRSPSGGDPTTDPLSYRNPLLLVPIFAFDVATDWQPGTGHFCQTLADTMQANAASLGIVGGPGDQWVVDVLVYGDGADDQQPLLLIGNHHYPVAAA